MNDLCDALNYVFNTLSEKCESYDFVYSFPERHSKFPIASPCVSVGISEAEIPVKSADYIALSAGKLKRYGTDAVCKIAIKICVPKTAEGLECYKAFDDIAAACMYLNEVDVTALKCGKISYNRLMGALVLDAELQINVLLVA